MNKDRETAKDRYRAEHGIDGAKTTKAKAAPKTEDKPAAEQPA